MVFTIHVFEQIRASLAMSLFWSNSRIFTEYLLTCAYLIGRLFFYSKTSSDAIFYFATLLVWTSRWDEGECEFSDFVMIDDEERVLFSFHHQKLDLGTQRWNGT